MTVFIWVLGMLKRTMVQTKYVLFALALGCSKVLLKLLREELIYLYK